MSSRIEKKTIEFLSCLAAHNDTEWFAAHREDYLSAKSNVENAARDLSERLAIANANVSPAHKLFRIYRDRRFSSNPKPYKENFGIIIGSNGKEETQKALYYLHIEPQKSFIGGGLYHPSAERIAKARFNIASFYQDLQKILENKTFKKYYPRLSGDTLKTSPKGYAKDRPAAEYLRYKDLLCVCPLSDEFMTSSDFSKKAIRALEILSPFIDFLNK